MSTLDASNFASGPGGSSAQDGFGDNFNKTANTIATGAIVAIVVCSALALASLGVLVWWFRRWTKRRRNREALPSAPLYYGPLPAAADAAAAHPPPSPPAAEMAGRALRREAPDHHHFHQQQKQQQQQQPPYYPGGSSTSDATAVESDSHPRYEMDGATGMGSNAGKGDRHV